MRFLIIFSFLMFAECLLSQQYFVYSIGSSGQKKALIRRAFYRNGLIEIKDFVQPDGNISLSVNYKYDHDNRLVKQIERHSGEAPFDIIREFNYNQKGQKTGELFGNNRTGKWGSYRFSYDKSERLDSTFIYAKNGDLIGYRVSEFVLDDTNRLVAEVRKRVDLKGKSFITGVLEYEYLDKNRSKITTISADGSIVMIEDITVNDFQKPKKIISAVEEATKNITFCYYDDKRRLEREENFRNGTTESTVDYKYDLNGILVETKYTYPDGTFSGEIHSLSENEIIIKTAMEKDEVIRREHENILAGFEEAGQFKEGYAWVKMDHKRYYFIDENGQPLLHYTFDKCHDFNGGLARVEDFNASKNYNGVGFIDTSGQVIIPLKFEKATDFKNGKAQVWVNGESWWIDEVGNKIED